MLKGNLLDYFVGVTSCSGQGTWPWHGTERSEVRRKDAWDTRLQKRLFEYD
jgi:hypothetical protein